MNDSIGIFDKYNEYPRLRWTVYVNQSPTDRLSFLAKSTLLSLAIPPSNSRNVKILPLSIRRPDKWV